MAAYCTFIEPTALLLIIAHCESALEVHCTNTTLKRLSLYYYVYYRSLLLKRVLLSLFQPNAIIGSCVAAANDSIFWVDNVARSISRIQRDLTGRDIVVNTGILGAEGLAVDWIAGEI